MVDTLVMTDQMETIKMLHVLHASQRRRHPPLDGVWEAFAGPVCCNGDDPIDNYKGKGFWYKNESRNLKEIKKL